MVFSIDHELARIFNFDEVDLAANRSGWLSPDQQQTFAAAARMRGHLLAQRFRRGPDPYVQPTVRTVEGTVEASPTMSGTWKLQVGAVTFEVDGGDVDAFSPERRYRIHFLDRGAATPAILSVEVADQESWKFSK